jgi:hypothetical protein
VALGLAGYKPSHFFGLTEGTTSNKSTRVIATPKGGKEESHEENLVADNARGLPYYWLADLCQGRLHGQLLR